MMGKFTAAIANFQRYDLPLKHTVSILSPKAGIAEPFAAVNRDMSGRLCCWSAVVAGIILCAAPVSIKKFFPEIESCWKKWRLGCDDLLAAVSRPRFGFPVS